MTASLYRLTDAGLVLKLRVTPNAGHDRIEGVELRADGSAVLRVRVQAVPDRGKANAAVVALLAKALGVPKRAVDIVGGETARLKTVSVGGEPAALIERLSLLSRPQSP